jgi:ABC-2 type transport system permease protein
MLMSVLLVAITAVFGRVLYGAEIPSGISLLRFLVMLTVGSASFCALGLAITSAIPNADAAGPIVNASIMPLLFLSGIFIAFDARTPSWVLWTARLFPVRHFVLGMQAGFLGTPFSWADVLIVAAWGVAGLLLAVRHFSWEPRTG